MWEEQDLVEWVNSLTSGSSNKLKNESTNNWIKKVLKFGAILLILVLIALYFYSPYLVVEVKNPLIESVRRSHIPKNIQLKENQQQICITHDGIRQTGILTASSLDRTKATILLIHGIRGNNGWWYNKSQALSKMGYQSLAIDLRAHGQSEGRFTTFGVKEKDDIQAWVDYIKQNINTNDYPLGIWGQSLGGAVALQALAIEPRIQFGIIESTFHDFEVVAGDYGQDYTGIKLKALTHHILQKAGRLADFNPEDAKPINACQTIHQPILFAHGNEDDKINIDYNQHNFEAIPHNNKSFMVIDGAGHYNLWEIGGNDYLQHVDTFISTIPKN